MFHLLKTGDASSWWHGDTFSLNNKISNFAGGFTKKHNSATHQQLNTTSQKKGYNRWCWFTATSPQHLSSLDAKTLWAWGGSCAWICHSEVNPVWSINKYICHQERQLVSADKKWLEGLKWLTHFNLGLISSCSLLVYGRVYKDLKTHETQSVNMLMHLCYKKLFYGLLLFFSGGFSGFLLF